MIKRERLIQVRNNVQERPDTDNGALSLREYYSAADQNEQQPNGECKHVNYYVACGAARRAWTRSIHFANCSPPFGEMHIASPSAERCASSCARSNIFFSYAAMATDGSDASLISSANAAPSCIARLAPAPANGDIRCAASPIRVTFGWLGQRMPTGRAVMGRAMKVSSQARI